MIREVVKTDRLSDLIFKIQVEYKRGHILHGNISYMLGSVL